MTVALMRAAAPGPTAPDFSTRATPSAAEAAQILEQVRHVGIAGDHYLEFELHALPRRGDETVYKGKLWGTRDERGPRWRFVLTDAAGKERRFLVQNGTQPAVWRWADGKTEMLGVAAWFQPLLDGVDLTPFDLVTPYIFWPDAKIEKLTRLRGRPTHQFIFMPPAAFTLQHKDLGAVRAYFDGQYNAMVQSELLGPDAKVLKTLSLVDLKKVGEQWIPKSIDVRNETTRDKARFQVTAAALAIQLAPALFTPAQLDEMVAAPTGAALVRIDP